jgi:hypothetical protein
MVILVNIFILFVHIVVIIVDVISYRNKVVVEDISNMLLVIYFIP